MDKSLIDERVKAAEEKLFGSKPNSVRDRTKASGGVSDAQMAKIMANYALKSEVGTRLSMAKEGIIADVHKLIASIPEVQARKTLEVVTELGDKIGEIKGVNHKTFATLVKAASVKDVHGNRKNIVLKGPAGSGKSTSGKRMAELLGLDFNYIGQTEMPHDVVGFINPVSGVYNSTPFVDTFINGGIIMLEEMDAWSPRATLVTNVPLANGYITLPNGVKHQRNKDCVIIACMNTWGTGATAEYVGRNKLDAAFLDRFAFKIDWSYDEAMERMIAGNDEVVDAVQAARFNAGHYGVKVIISPRSSIDIADMVRSGFGLLEAMDMNFLSSCDKDQRRMLLEGVDV